ncbi:MAG: dockerin type I repeat-containing protein, partial [Planctomycetes bacterium]|nr:dockerin type I repeat-containing protein [Planctomycetota bacterium]
LRANDSAIFRLKRDVPPVLPVDFLSCEQTTLADEVAIQFTNAGPYDSIEVYRDDSLLVTLPGTATSYLDLTASPGRHAYAVVPTTGAAKASPRRCELRVGNGAVLRRKLAFPLASPYQLTRDPSNGMFYATSNSASAADEYAVFDANLDFVGTLPSAVEVPFQVAAFAVRPVPGGSEIWSIAWEVPAPWLQPQTLLLSVQDAADGSLIQLPSIIDIPGAGVGVALTYPTGMTYDETTDTFWFLERNTDTFWQMDTNGELLQSVPHPMPPLQDFVFNLGLQVEADRGGLTATTARPEDREITIAMGISFSGTPTGGVIELDDVEMSALYGMVRANERLWVTGSEGSLAQLVEVKAGDALTYPADLTCTEDSPLSVTLTWTEPVSYDEVVVRRSGIPIAVVPGGIGTFSDPGVPVGPRTYTIAGRTATEESTPVACGITVTGGGPTFVRGDASRDGAVDISDAVSILGYLFAMGPTPSCLDAADVDDSGDLNITDPIYLLSYLFTAGPQPPSPFPAPGGDPTGDSLDCS